MTDDILKRRRNHIVALLSQADKLRAEAGNAICALYPAEMRVAVRIRSGQKNLSPATVAAHPSWQDGCINVVLDNSKARSRQKFRRVHIMNVFPLGKIT